LACGSISEAEVIAMNAQRHDARGFRTARTFALCLAALYMLVAPALAQTPAPAGRWEGAISVPGTELKIALTLKPATAGAWSGTIDIPRPRRARFATGQRPRRWIDRFVRLAGIAWCPFVQGSVASDATSISGTFTQGGQSVPFTVRRTADPAAAAASALNGFDDFVLSAMKSWNVPGMAVAIVKDGQLVLAKGYGLRNIQGNLHARFVVEPGKPTELKVIQPNGVFTLRRASGP
jgi:CubicO group peptidase (beta-lactamase class C family)